jgi:hypothetical protein
MKQVEGNKNRYKYQPRYHAGGVNAFLQPFQYASPGNQARLKRRKSNFGLEYVLYVSSQGKQLL